MALRIRLRRMGRRNAPTYRVVVAESSRARDGRIVENIGHYNPRTEPITLSVDRARALHWLERGATPTETAKALLKKAGVFRPEESAVSAAATAVVDAAKSGAQKVASAAKGAAAAAAAAVGDVAEAVRERVGGGEETTESAGEVPASEASAPAEEPAPAAPAGEAGAATTEAAATEPGAEEAEAKE